MHGGGWIDREREDPLQYVSDQGGEVAAVCDDGQGEFPPQRVARHNAEVATDVGDDGADRAAADLGCDVLGRGQTGETCVGCTGASVHGSGGARLARGWGARGGCCGLLADKAAGQSGFERGGAKQAAGNAREDFPDVDGAEVSRDVGKVGGGGALLQRAGELPAVVDQRADEAEETPGAAGCVRAGGRPILVRIGAVGWNGGGGRGGHERDRSISGGLVARNIFPITQLTKQLESGSMDERDRPVPSQTEVIEEWVRGFLWEFYDSGMSNTEAAEIIVATVEKQLSASRKTRSEPLPTPQELFQAWKMQGDRT
jgi:hypothetical protein